MNAPLPQSVLPPQLSVTLLASDEVVKTFSDAGSAVAIAESYTVDSHDMAVHVNNELKETKARLKRAEEIREEWLKPLRELVDVTNRHTQPTIVSLKAAEQVYKNKLAVWTRQEQDRVAVEQRAAEEAQTKARQKAAQEAAAAQAIADEKAREQQRIADEAEANRKKALAAGDAKGAAAAAATAAKATEKAASLVANGQNKATETVLAAETAVAPAVRQVAAVAGFGTRKNWKARLKPRTTEVDALDAIIAEVGKRPELRAYLLIDMSSINKTAKAQEGLFNIPGFEAFNEPIAASRSK